MMAIRVPPGRAGLLWLRHRLDVATHGTTLLRQKLAILSAEAQRLDLLTQRTGRELAELIGRADDWLARAAVTGGQRAIRLATPAATATVEPAWTTVMGVRYPAEPRCILPERTPDAAPLAGAALIHADAAYRAAVPAAVRHAAATEAQRRVTIEIAATRQRVRALDRHWIPALREALAVARLRLEELEHADAVRRRWATAPDHPREHPP